MHCHVEGRGRGLIYRSKDKGHPIKDYKGPEGEWRQSCALSLTSALDVVCGQRHTPAVYSRETEPVPIVQEAGWAPGPVWTDA